MILFCEALSLDRAIFQSPATTSKSEQEDGDEGRVGHLDLVSRGEADVVTHIELTELSAQLGDIRSMHSFKIILHTIIC